MAVSTMAIKSLTDEPGSSFGLVEVVEWFINKFPDNLRLVLTGWICRVVLIHENEISFNDY